MLPTELYLFIAKINYLYDIEVYLCREPILYIFTYLPNICLV